MKETSDVSVAGCIFRLTQLMSICYRQKVTEIVNFGRWQHVSVCERENKKLNV